MAEASSAATCSICYSESPKYRCPRCLDIRTCSLPCYKRHQQRATCNGQRNESSYLKKSELSTAAALDHDYNFLTKIERAVQSAQSDSVQASRPPKRRKLASNSSLSEYLRNNDITVHEAPQGLQRSKANQTRFLPKSRKVAWTVEWVDAENRTHVTEVMEDEKISHAYAVMAARFLGGPKAKRNGSDNTAKEEKSSDVPLNGPKESLEERATPPAASQAASKESMPEDSAGNAHGRSNGRTSHTAAAPPVHIYLLHPRSLASKGRVLQELDTSQTLTACLAHVELDEYPTLHHLPYPPDQLPAEVYCKYEE